MLKLSVCGSGGWARRRCQAGNQREDVEITNRERITSPAIKSVVIFGDMFDLELGCATEKPDHGYVE
jgi:hypothetical protein